MSKQLDDELAQAAGLNSNEAANVNVTKNAPAITSAIAEQQPPRTDATRARVTSPALLLGLLAITGSLVGLFMFGFKDGAAIYAIPVDQLLAQQDKMMNRKVRIEAELVPGTLAKRDKPCEYRFKVHGKGEQQLTVSYPQCVVTESLRDVPDGGVMVTVEGALKSPGSFEASLIMAKCPSKYDPKTHKINPGEPSAQGMPVN